MNDGGLVGKYVKVFYDDLGKVSCKEGKCTSNSETEIELRNELIIPKSRIVRIEIIGGGGGSG